MDGDRHRFGDAEITPPQPQKRQKTFHDGRDDGVQACQTGLAPSHDQYLDYTVAWICALHTELAAAQAMLDEKHDVLPPRMLDSNTYTLGRIKKHNVIITCLPTNQYGAINAANVLTHLVRTFPSVRVGLMVGIGGGVPSKADIRLGDVVVGIRVMQSDLGKIIGVGEIQRTAIPRIPHLSLSTTMSFLRAKHEEHGSQIPFILEKQFEGYSEYGRPKSPDSLFIPTYPHESTAPGCAECDQSKLVLRSRRSTDGPLIHYGAVASGNQVMRSAIQRDEIARQLDVICFEMEAAGLMDILPCLVIRGICDYSDSHKNKTWQRYAAATAAAYAREFLEVLPETEVRARSGYTSHTTQNSSNAHRHQLLESLKFGQMDSRQLSIKAAHAKTCRWFLKHPVYKDWLDPETLTRHHGFLWIRGKPGAGKSTLMKFAYSNMRKARRNQALTACFFFHARGEYLERSIVGMYRSLLFQLLQGYADLQATLEDADLAGQGENGCPSLDVLQNLFRSAVLALGQRPFTCFIDALDECDEQQVMNMVQYFEDLAEQATESGIAMRICFSSRHYPYIVIQRGIKFTLEGQPGHTEDLENYVASRLRIQDPALIEELQPQLLKKAQGVFLWVVLVVEILNEEYRHGGMAIRKKFAEMPSGLNELFQDMLGRNNENMKHLLLCILWILCAKRPLRPGEFHHALWSGLSPEGLADPELPDATVSGANDSVDRCVISYSKGLAEITKGKEPKVQFIHESVRDFLLNAGGLHALWPNLGFDWKVPSHERLKQCCDMYLNHHMERSPIGNLPSEAHAEAFKKYPFLEYASQHVLYHADLAAEAISQDEFLSQFPVQEWVSIINHFERYKARHYTSEASLLYILAEKDFSKLIRTRLRSDPKTEIVGERYRYPLFTAFAHGSKAAVAALLNSPSTICNGVDFTSGL